MTTINFNFYINGNKTNALAEALGAAFAVSNFEADRDDGAEVTKPTAEAAAVTTAAQTQEVPLSARILAVLNDKSQYRKRSLGAIAKAVGVTEDVASAELTRLNSDGVVLRSSRSGLFYTEGTGATSPDTTDSGGALRERIVDFLSDTSEYTYRSLKAIAKGVGSDEATVQRELNSMLDDEDVSKTDGGLYYV